MAEPTETEARWTGEQDVLPVLGRPLRLGADRWALKALTATLERLKPDVIHTHASKAGALGRLAARRLGVPCVHTFHGHVLRDYFGPIRSAMMRMIERRLAPWARLTATGPSTASELERILATRVGLLEPGIALPPAAAGTRQRLRRSWGDPRRVALMVGRAAAVKRPGRFVEAARAAGYLPVIAGAVGVPGALCLGTVERMEEVYAACDVVVCSSVREGTPFSILEAMWCGKPVVARPVGDVAWLVGDAGIVTDDLAGALRNLPPDLGARAAERVRTRFPADAVAPRLLSLYGEMV